VIVRPATEADVPLVVEQVAGIAEEGWILTEPPVDREARAAAVRAMLGDVLVVEDGGEVVGHAGLHASPAPGVWWFGMGVAPAARRRGAGGALLDAVVAGARERGAHKLELEVWPENEAAIALYASRGFVVEGRRRDHHRRRDGSLRSVVLMALLL
jgi:RimJ/RimL family protein N-acetyltransferase